MMYVCMCVCGCLWNKMRNAHFATSRNMWDNTLYSAGTAGPRDPKLQSHIHTYIQARLHTLSHTHTHTTICCTRQCKNKRQNLQHTTNSTQTPRNPLRNIRHKLPFLCVAHNAFYYRIFHQNYLHTLRRT